jgi:predicted nucleotidyltransferase
MSSDHPGDPLGCELVLHNVHHCRVRQMRLMERKKTVNEILTEITDRVRTGYDPERIMLYGSHAYGCPHVGSDIDIFIIKDDADRPIDRRLKVRRLLRDIIREIPVSPIVYTPKEVKERLDEEDPFLMEILEKGEVLYERKGSGLQTLDK